MQKTLELSVAGQRLVMRADRSLWWPAKKILFIADLHAGKVEHFQRAGQRLPGGSLQSDLNRLEQAVAELRPKRLIVLGDLFHSDINDELGIVGDWARILPCSFELVRGNHDRFISDEQFIAQNIMVHKEGLHVEPFTLRHHPLPDPGDRVVLCGHLHPVCNVRGSGYDRLRLACFAIKDDQVMLPAFGSFAGGYVIDRKDYDTVVGVSPDYQGLLSVKSTPS